MGVEEAQRGTDGPWEKAVSYYARGNVCFSWIRRSQTGIYILLSYSSQGCFLKAVASSISTTRMVAIRFAGTFIWEVLGIARHVLSGPLWLLRASDREQGLVAGAWTNRHYLTSAQDALFQYDVATEGEFCRSVFFFPICPFTSETVGEGNCCDI